MTKCRDGCCQIFWGGPCICAIPDWPFPPLKDDERTIMDRAELQRRQDVLVAEGRAIK